MKNPLASLIPGGSMNLASLLQTMGINLADVEKSAQNVIKELRDQLTAIHTKLDKIDRQNSAIATALIEMDKKLDSLQVTNGRAASSSASDDSSRGNQNSDSNRTDASASASV